MASLAARLDRLEGHRLTKEDHPAFLAAHATLTADIEAAAAARVAQRLGVSAEAVIAEAVAAVQAEYAARAQQEQAGG